MKKYCQVITGNSLGIINGEELFQMSYSEPMTLQDILKQEIPDLRKQIESILLSCKYRDLVVDRSISSAEKRFASIQPDVDAIMDLLGGQIK